MLSVLSDPIESCAMASSGVVNFESSNKFASLRMSVGTANAARVSKGTQHDVWTGLSVKDPQRHPREHITVTCVIYNTIEGGVPSEADVMAAIKDMERLYRACGQAKHIS